MSIETVDHFEAMFDSNYLRWFDIAGKGDVPCTIESVSKEELTLPGGSKKRGPVVKIKNGSKPLVLNKTNARSIADIHGEKQSGWRGKRIVLYVGTTKLKGKTVNCIAIKPESQSGPATANKGDA